MWKVLIAFAAASVAASSATNLAQEQANRPSVRGAWRVTEIRLTGPNARTISQPQPGLYIFTDRHFSILRVNGDKPRAEIDSTRATASELRATYDDGLTAQSGTYEVSGSALTTRAFVAKEPRIMDSGAFVTYSFALGGNTLTLTNAGSHTGPPANPTTVRLVRVE